MINMSLKSKDFAITNELIVNITKYMLLSKIDAMDTVFYALEKKMKFNQGPMLIKNVISEDDLQYIIDIVEKHYDTLDLDLISMKLHNSILI